MKNFFWGAVLIQADPDDDGPSAGPGWPLRPDPVAESQLFLGEPDTAMSISAPEPLSFASSLATSAHLWF